MTSDLITRLSKLDAPDREVDAEIAEYLGIVPLDYERAIIHGATKNFFWHKTDSKAPYLTWEFTSSVDAVLALAERKLPDANVLIGWGQTKETKPWARIGVIPSHDATGFNLATALLIALLRAKEASNGIR